MTGTRTEQPRICVGTGASLPALVLLACVALTAQCSGQEPTYSTWDRFFYKVELPVKAAAPASEVKLFVYHSYPTPLHDVGAVGTSASLTVTRQPAVMQKLDPTEIASFVFAVQRTGAASLKRASLTVALRARELPGSKPVELTVPLTAKAEKELQAAARGPGGHHGSPYRWLGKPGVPSVPAPDGGPTQLDAVAAQAAGETVRQCRWATHS